MTPWFHPKVGSTAAQRLATLGCCWSNLSWSATGGAHQRLSDYVVGAASTRCQWHRGLAGRVVQTLTMTLPSSGSARSAHLKGCQRRSRCRWRLDFLRDPVLDCGLCVDAVRAGICKNEMSKSRHVSEGCCLTFINTIWTLVTVVRPLVTRHENFNRSF